jgi:hypothetical protein
MAAAAVVLYSLELLLVSSQREQGLPLGLLLVMLPCCCLQVLLQAPSRVEGCMLRAEPPHPKPFLLFCGMLVMDDLFWFSGKRAKAWVAVHTGWSSMMHPL